MKQEFGSFSDAIRHGATLSPQCFGELEQGGATCAIGAGMLAMGLGFDAWPTVAQTYEYLNDMETLIPCPACERVWLRYKVITHLNDFHRWTRRRIADWLQSEEDKLGFVTLSVTEESQATLDLKTELSELGETLRGVSVTV